VDHVHRANGAAANGAGRNGAVADAAEDANADAAEDFAVAPKRVKLSASA
jgi:hypothetical protein